LRRSATLSLTTNLVSAGGQRELARRRPAGPFGDAVDDAAAAAAPEDHRIGAFEDLDALGVVEIAIVLDVVAHAVDEEVRGRGIAAQRRRIAVAFALAHGHAGHVAHDIGHRAHALIGDDIVRDDGDRLGHVAQRRVRAGRGRQIALDVFGPLADHGDRIARALRAGDRRADSDHAERQDERALQVVMRRHDFPQKPPPLPASEPRVVC
jgi:hypothetical protein